jgi:hypothetical protein
MLEMLHTHGTTVHVSDFSKAIMNNIIMYISMRIIFITDATDIKSLAMAFDYYQVTLSKQNMEYIKHDLVKYYWLWKIMNASAALPAELFDHLKYIKAPSEVLLDILSTLPPHDKNIKYVANLFANSLYHSHK